MKKILGLDLGSGSIGWALVNYSTNIDELSILGIGSRTISFDGSTLADFNNGQQITINSARTSKRTARKTFDRYQMRRKMLNDFFAANGVTISHATATLNREDLWNLRAKAVTEPITAEELARVLLHINQKRGYKASKSDLDPENKASRGYVAEVKSRYDELRASGLTYGQWCAKELANNPDFRIKDRVYPRASFIEEFDRIVERQKKYHPEFLSERNIDILRNKIIFYQRPLKSCKHLVSTCEFEQRQATTPDGRTISVGPKVAQRSNPLFQLCRIWQAVNNIVLTDRYGNKQTLEFYQKECLVDYLRKNKKLDTSTFNRIIFGKPRQNTWLTGKALGAGIAGDKTFLAIKAALNGKYQHLLRFDVGIERRVDESTGEVLPDIIPAGIVDAPYYQMWHCIYSISSKEDLEKTLKKRFGIDDAEVLDNLSNIDFVKEGYGNMSVKAIRRILPYLMQGMMYSEACEAAGFRHSDYLTRDENEQRPLQKHLDQLRKGELRQPIVEKILNQMVNLVNALIDKYGQIDEIVVELARELRSSRDERADTAKRNRENEKNNARLADLIKEFGLVPTRSRIIKYKLWEESGKCCVYCGAPVGIKEFLLGYDAEVEHIIPRSVLFDDGFSNKVCSCRNCNHGKNDMTAYDFMKSRGERLFNEYIDRINELKNSKIISESKFRKLLMSADQIPEDFISRQLNESRYISRKAMEMLRTVCRDVRATSGSVTDYLRHVWGWDRILHNLNLDTYRKASETEFVTNEHRGNSFTEERIINWSKRLDHRHHAIDALTIACTTQAFIQRLNNLNSLKDMKCQPFIKQGEEHREKQNRLEQYALSMPHFSTARTTEAVASILVSFRPSTKLVTPGKRYIRRGGKRVLAQSGIKVPRGGMHEETVFGSIQSLNEKGRPVREIVVKYKYIEFQGNGNKRPKDPRTIVDRRLRNLFIERLREFDGKTKEAFAQPLYSDAAKTKQIRSVRCFTGNKVAIPIKYDQNGEPIGFVNPGSNYHIALYIDASGKVQEHVATFFHCVQRRLHGIPAIIKDPQAVWDDINSRTEDLPEEFLQLLPDVKWKFMLSMQRNEMFVLGMDENEFRLAIERNDKTAIAPYLYRVQKLTSGQYCFSRHTITDTSKIDLLANKSGNRFYRASANSISRLNPHKVKINNLGEITEVVC